jgi:hypothetical protein
MSFQNQALTVLYGLVKFLATVPFAKRFLISNQYQYDDTVLRLPLLPPLAMTKVDTIIGGLPKLPKEDEVPDQKWISLVLSTLSLLNKINDKKSSEFIN